mgnify:CR=1 FL=1
MARRGGTDYAKWASFDEEDDDPLAKLTISTERRHPSLPKVVRKRPEGAAVKYRRSSQDTQLHV